jgi:8-oxo-dGTP pyrophosphatase MutT (NUDIX family)
MYTIFKNDCVFYITDNKEFSIKPNFFYWDKFHFQDNLIICDSSVALTFYLYHSDIEFLWKEFKNKFKIIDAAGGVVFNKNNEILFIYRLDKWDLPKGKVEKGETIPETAIREVQEECGINKVIIDNFIGKTYHIYTYKEKEILKISYWYKMYSNENELIPQLEEDITKVVWKNRREVQKAMKNTYANIRLLFESMIS